MRRFPGLILLSGGNPIYEYNFIDDHPVAIYLVKYYLYVIDIIHWIMLIIVVLWLRDHSLGHDSG